MARNGISKTLAILVVIVLIVAAVAAMYFTMPKGVPETTTPTTTTPTTTTPTTTTTTTTTTTPTTTTSPTTTTPSPTTTTTTPAGQWVEFEIHPGVTIRVTPEFYQFIQQAKNGEITATVNLGVQMAEFEVDLLNQIAEQFHNEYPGITIQIVNYGDLKSIAKAALAAGEGPHIFTWAHDWMGEMEEGGYIIPLDDYVDPQSLEGMYDPLAWKAAVWKDKLYGMPWAAEALVLLYNTDIISEPPSTWNETMSIMDQWMLEKGLGYYGLAEEMNSYHAAMWVHAFGGFYLNETTGEVGLNSTGTIMGYEFIMNNLRPFMAYSDVSHQTQLSLFIDGFTPFYITGPWDFRGIKRSGVNFKVTRIPPVIINGVEYYPKPYAGIKIMWVHKLSVEQGVDNAAVLFTLWFSTSKDVVITLAEEAGFVPVLADAAQDPRVTSIPEVAGVIEQLKHAILMPRSVTMAKVWGPIGNAFSLIWNEQTTVEEALNQAQMEALESISGG